MKGWKIRKLENTTEHGLPFFRQTDAKPEQRELVLEYMEAAAEKQGGLINPANIRAPDCPKL